MNIICVEKEDHTVTIDFIKTKIRKSKKTFLQEPQETSATAEIAVDQTLHVVNSGICREWKDFTEGAKSPSEELGGNEIITGTNNSLTEHSQYQFYVQERKVESQTAISKDKRSQIENPSKKDSKQDSSTKHFGREKESGGF